MLSDGVESITATLQARLSLLCENLPKKASKKTLTMLISKFWMTKN